MLASTLNMVAFFGSKLYNNISPMSVYSSKEKQKTFTNGESDGVIKTEDGLSGKRESSGVCQENQ